MLFIMYTMSISVFWLQIINGGHALLSNVTATNPSVSTKSLGTTIPQDFTIERRLALPISFSPETGYYNIIAALCIISSADFESRMPPALYRTTRFQQPIIRIATHGDVDVPNRYIVWGLFLIAFYLRESQRFSLAFFVLKWKGKEVAGISIDERILSKPQDQSNATVASLPVGALQNDRPLVIQYEYLAGAKHFEQGAVYLTIIGALTTAAPSDIKARITRTWISFLNSEPCVFIITPSLAARTAPPYFTYEDLNLVLAKTSDFFTAHARYSPLSMNISIDDVEVAQAALTSKFDGHSLTLSAIG
ncbi:hypothetical protein G7Y79_00002g007350 [Physcia stellaris]|nr:hypothetical protein G7Y79_00002g007350 [Physcia stellaris]